LHKYKKYWIAQKLNAFTINFKLGE